MEQISKLIWLIFTTVAFLRREIRLDTLLYKWCVDTKMSNLINIRLLLYTIFALIDHSPVGRIHSEEWA